MVGRQVGKEKLNFYEQWSNEPKNLKVSWIIKKDVRYTEFFSHLIKWQIMINTRLFLGILLKEKWNSPLTNEK